MTAAPAAPRALRVLVTRPAGQASQLAALLAAAGATPIEVAAIEVRDVPLDPLVDAVAALADYDDVVFTSANAVDAFLRAREVVAARAASAGAAAARQSGNGPRVCAVGSSTAASLARAGMPVDVSPAGAFTAESLAAAMIAAGAAGRRVLFPRAAQVRDVLAPSLRAAGARVDEVVCYDVAPADGAAARLRDAIAGGVDVVTVASGRTVDALLALADEAGVRAEVEALPWASIGPVTTARARSHGVDVAVEAAVSTMPGLVAAVVERFGRAG